MGGMTSYLGTLARYNVWANRKIIDFVKKAGPAKAETTLISSFPTIHLTLLHIWDAQFIWYERLNGRSPLTWPGKEFNGDLNDLSDGLSRSSDDLVAYCDALTSDDLESSLTYHNTKGLSFENTRQEILSHLFNHGTFHRGQVVTMLRNTGFTDLEQTDLIEYYRASDQYS